MKHRARKKRLSDFEVEADINTGQDLKKMWSVFGQD